MNSAEARASEVTRGSPLLKRGRAAVPSMEESTAAWATTMPVLT